MSSCSSNLKVWEQKTSIARAFPRQAPFVTEHQGPNRANAALTFNATTDINWELTAPARVGYAWDNILFYVTGDLALLGAKTTLSTLSGLTCGTFGIIGSGPGELAARAPISGLAEQLEPALNMGLRQIGVRRLNIVTPQPPRWRPHASMRCALPVWRSLGRTQNSDSIAPRGQRRLDLIEQGEFGIWREHARSRIRPFRKCKIFLPALQ
jgi:hypothetical protein